MLILIPVFVFLTTAFAVNNQQAHEDGYLKGRYEQCTTDTDCEQRFAVIEVEPMPAIRYDSPKVMYCVAGSTAAACVVSK